jgi:O-antigen ligase
MNKEMTVNAHITDIASASLRQLPFMVKAVMLLTVLACVGNSFIEEIPISAIGWLVPLILAFIILFRAPSAIKFPYMIWVPWAVYLLFYLIDADAPNALQRTIMMLCPVIVGLAVSTLKFGEQEFNAFRKAYIYMAIIFIAGVLFKTGILLTGTLPEATGLASEVMTGSLLCALFAASYAFGRPKDIFWWAALALIPVIAVTRMGMVATGLTLPLTLAPLRLVKRVTFVVVIIAAALLLFQSERVQKKSFYKGSGTIQDVKIENPDFATSGRSAMWEALEYEIGKEPWFGHGANAVEPFLKKIQGPDALTHPHNDWLRIEYEYGYVGAGLFALTLLIQFSHLWRFGKRSSGDTRLLFYAGASSIITFCLFMFSDNIILYTAFFGNLQFTIMGIAYAAYNEQADQAIQKKKIRIVW